MKKQLFLFISLLSLGASAQNTFPSPYCDVTTFYEVEKITSVSLNGSIITNDNGTLPLINKTNSIIDLVKGNEYTITLKGSTEGNYVNRFIMYIDWNQNNILNDSGEDYILGTIENSTGLDNQEVTFTFTVPDTATLGQTRIRINKGYEYPEDEWGDFSAMTNDPCNITTYGISYDEAFEDEENYGQMLDFTLNIIESNASLPSLNLSQIKVYPNPSTDFIQFDHKDNISKASIFDLNGRELGSYEMKSATNSISVDFLSSGTYLLKIETETNETSIIKFVKN